MTPMPMQSGTTTPTTTTTPPPNISTGTSSTLAPWTEPYLKDLWSQSSALTQMPYQWYQGALTSGQSGLQNRAFEGLGSLQMPDSFDAARYGLGSAMEGFAGLGYDPQTVSGNMFNAPGAYNPSNITTGQWNQKAAQQYMNPYLQQSLNPQLDEARRQAQITRTGDASRLAQAGAYGGSRQAIMESELNRNLMRNQADITGKGYFDAYNTGMQGFMQDQGRALDARKATEQSKQFGYGQQMNAADLKARYGMDAARLNADDRQFAAKYGLDALTGLANTSTYMGNLGTQMNKSNLDNLEAMLQGGATQRDIEQAGLTAEYEMWAQAQQFPYKNLEFMKSMLAGVPSVIDKDNPLDDVGQLIALMSGAKGLGDSGIYDMIKQYFGKGGAE
jgi:hypothetical protein